MVVSDAIVVASNNPNVGEKDSEWKWIRHLVASCLLSFLTLLFIEYLELITIKYAATRSQGACGLLISILRILPVRVLRSSNLKKPLCSHFLWQQGILQVWWPVYCWGSLWLDGVVTQYNHWKLCNRHYFLRRSSHSICIEPTFQHVSIL